MNKRFFVTIFIVFVMVTAVSFGIKMLWSDFSFVALMGGNILMLLLSVSSYFLVQRKVGKRPEAFVTGVNGATFLKLMICMAAAFLYVFFNKENLHKPSLFTLFGIYIAYSAVETILLSKLVKKV